MCRPTPSFLPRSDAGLPPLAGGTETNIIGQRQRQYNFIMPAERIQKLLAAAGYGSRRTCEKLIAAGRVQVNGRIAILGAKADPVKDLITLDGSPITASRPIYIILNKPRHVLSSLKPQGGRRTVRDLVPLSDHLYPAGRLDAESEGLILLTNDGELTNRLTHPRYGHEKEYHVLISGEVPAKTLEAWRHGVVIKDETGRQQRTLPAKVRVLSKSGNGRGGTWLAITMREGKKRQIRRVAETLGLHVVRLIRVRLGPLQLGNLQAGEWRYLTPAEIRRLNIGLPGGERNGHAIRSDK